MSKRLLLAGLASFLIALISLFPARAAIGWFAPEQVRIGGISGTVWTGRASAVEVDGIALSNVEWSLSPLSLLMFSPTVDISAQPARGIIQATLRFSGSGDLDITNLDGGLPLSLIASAVQTTGLEGDARLRFTEIRIRDGFPEHAVGTANVSALRVPQAFNGNLGGFQLEFVESQDGILASIEDVDGIVDVAGTITLRLDRSYTLLAQVAARPTTPPALNQALRLLPRGNAANQYEVRLEGSL